MSNKTCGTCYWMMIQPGHGFCGACGNPLCNEKHDPVAYANGFYEYTTIDGDCNGEFWKPKEEPCSERAEPIIRCRDCRHYKIGNHPNVSGKFCHWLSEFEERDSGTVLIAAYFSEPNDFCAWAEKVS